MTASTNTCTWTGTSGTAYTYHYYPLGTVLRPVPGNYVFGYRSASGGWVALYVGQTEDLNARFDDHHKIDCAKSRGATHVHARVNNGGRDARLREEADLIMRYRPPCNG